MRVFVDDEGWIELDDGMLVAEGGQGRVFANGERAYKIASVPAAILDPRKLAILATIRSDRVIKPLASIRAAPGGDVVGHAMRLVRRAIPWMQLVPRAARSRHGIDRSAALVLCERLRELVAELHALDIAAVDLSSNNVLVDTRRRVPYLIDVDSMQTPGFPATAITPQIEDPLAQGRHGPASDWFAFAILAFELLVGIHPFRGTHPRVQGLAARMAAGISVLDGEVTRPPVCEDLDTLPATLLAWFDDTFCGRLRAPPPTSVTTKPAMTRRGPARALARSDGGIIRGAIVDATAGRASRVWWWTDERIGCDDAIVGATPEGAIGLVRRPMPGGAASVAMLCHADDGGLALVVPGGTVPCALGVTAAAVRVDGGEVLLRCGDRLAHLDLRARAAGADPSRSHWASVRLLGRVHATSCVLWSGCATTRWLGTWRVSAIDDQRVMQRDLAELGTARIVDASAHAGIVAILAEVAGRHDCWVFDARAPHDAAVVVERDVDPFGCAVFRADDGQTWVRLASGLVSLRDGGVGPASPVGDGAIIGGAGGPLRVVGDEVWPLAAALAPRASAPRRRA